MITNLFDPRLLTIAAAAIPALALLYYFYRRDLNPEPRGALLKTFFLGVLTTLAVIVLTRPIDILGGALADSHPVMISAFLAFIGAAIPEEGAKFWVLMRYSARHRAFEEPMDGIVYGVAASLGFATLENILYVSAGGWPAALLRAFTAVPAHACFGAMMGYYIGQAFFVTQRPGTAWRGLLLAMLVHGLYDWFLMTITYSFESATEHWRYPGQRFEVMGLAAVGWLFLMIFQVIWVVRKVRALRRQQISDAATAPPAITGASTPTGSLDFSGRNPSLSEDE